MPENYSPSGTVSATPMVRPTAAEALTGAVGDDLRDNFTEIADRTRYLAADGTTTDEAQVTPTLLNGWVDYNAATDLPARYYKGRNGRVYVSGVVKSGTTTVGTVFFNLPSGYRPAQSAIFPVYMDGGTGFIKVLATGDVTVTLASAVATALNFNFRV